MDATLNDSCRVAHDADAPIEATARAIRKCGYAHIKPGLFPAEYVRSIDKHVRRYWSDVNNSASAQDAFQSGAVRVESRSKTTTQW